MSERHPYENVVFFKSSESMTELSDDSVDLVITSPPYFDIKDYSRDGYQKERHSEPHPDDIGSISNYEQYLFRLLKVWRECERVMSPNAKLCINVPMMPLPKSRTSGHTRTLLDIAADIQKTILQNTSLMLFDKYVWERTNWTKRLMFGSYPYPPNLYAQNYIEFVVVFVKPGKPRKREQQAKELSRLTQAEWLEFTKPIWRIPAPHRGDPAYGHHPAIMPQEIARRCIRMYSFVDDLVLDPFAGSGTTLKAALDLGRRFVGYEVYSSYKGLIEKRLGFQPTQLFLIEV